MKIDNNLVIICLTFIICIHIIMNKLVEMIIQKNASKILENNKIDEVIKNYEELNKMKGEM